jgi:hypothetical protein
MSPSESIMDINTQKAISGKGMLTKLGWEPPGSHAALTVYGSRILMIFL